MKKRTKKPQPTYSDSFKLGIVMRVANGQLSKEQARVTYNIGGNSSILQWMRKFGYCSEPVIDKPMATAHDKPDPEQLKKKIRQLEKQLKNERIRSEFYQTMIDVAERELGISIVKKSDTNPSD
jgi:transposase-like protein